MSEWRAVASAPSYEICREGQLRRAAPGRGAKVGRPVSVWVDRYGYAFVRLGLGRGVPRNFKLSRLVCEAFHGPAPSPTHHAAHNDGNPANNAVDNLRWATPAENNADKRLHGTHLLGERHAGVKVTDAELRSARQQFTGARGQVAQFARDFGISRSTAYNLLHQRVRSGQMPC
ncbi:HNH endonuclease [Sphingomonas sp. URHD0057]|uniref:HNH endonuclease n=1 Tax=Sphingomonas sp. URHD0057 TaxID=1380389 RepID=UPI0009DF783C